MGRCRETWGEMGRYREGALEHLVASVVLRVVPSDLELVGLAQRAARRRRLEGGRHLHRSEPLVRVCDHPLGGEDVRADATRRLPVRDHQVWALLVRVRVRGWG